MKRFFAALLLAFSVTDLLAQSASPDGAAAAMAGAGFAALFGGCYLLSCLTGVAVWLFVAIWVMRDARSRQSPNAQLVTVLAWIPPTWLIGLIVHLVTRPKGNLVPCPHCQKKRLQGSTSCPHCGQP